jgi:hypothetical protein
MKEKYDFSNAEQGKFYVPLSELQVPIYLDEDIAEYFAVQRRVKPESLSVLVNDLLRKDIEIANRVSS